MKSEPEPEITYDDFIYRKLTSAVKHVSPHYKQPGYILINKQINTSIYQSINPLFTE